MHNWQKETRKELFWITFLTILGSYFLGFFSHQDLTFGVVSLVFFTLVFIATWSLFFIAKILSQKSSNSAKEKSEATAEGKMKIIKECTDRHIVLRTNHYTSTLDCFDMLFAEAKKDFPALERKDVTVSHCGGEKYRKTFGIEFEHPNKGEVPDGYFQINQLEQT